MSKKRSPLLKTFHAALENAGTGIMKLGVPQPYGQRGIGQTFGFRDGCIMTVFIKIIYILSLQTPIFPYSGESDILFLDDQLAFLSIYLQSSQLLCWSIKYVISRFRLPYLLAYIYYLTKKITTISSHDFSSYPLDSTPHENIPFQAMLERAAEQIIALLIYHTNMSRDFIVATAIQASLFDSYEEVKKMLTSLMPKATFQS
jgi:hypothetical protein